VQMAERRCHGSGGLLPHGASRQREPGQVAEPSLREHAEHFPIGTLVGPEPDGGLDVVVRHRLQVGPPPVGKTALAQP